jgi:FkbM family methyltransferase
LSRRKGPRDAARAALERLNPYLRLNLGWESAKRRGDAERALVDSIVRKGMVVADIGASAGEFTARLAKLVGRRGVVHSFEPHPVHRERLDRLAASRRQIEFHPLALSNRAGSAELHVPVIRSRVRYGLATLRPIEGDSSVSVALDRLDLVLDGIERLDFVKCDVEGHERSVLEGGAGTITRLKPTLMLEIEQRHLADGGMDAVFAMLNDWGYSGEALFPTGLRPLADFDIERDQLAFMRAGQDSMPTGYVNMFLLSPRDAD